MRRPQRQKELTPEIVRDLWEHMARKYGVRLVQKGESSKMKIAAYVLCVLGYMSYKNFMKGYATTVKKNIYLPFEIGVATDRWPLYKQIEICAHEFRHVWQYLKEGWRYCWNYLRSSAKRSNYEGDANVDTVCIHWWRYRVLPSLRALARKLGNYGCSKLDISVTEKRLKIAAPSIEAGKIPHETTKAVIEFLNRRMN